MAAVFLFLLVVMLIGAILILPNRLHGGIAFIHKLWAMPCMLFMTASAALAGTPYHGVTVSALDYFFSGNLGIDVINNTSLIKRLVPGVTTHTLSKYAVVMNDVTGEIDVADKTTGPVANGVVLGVVGVTGSDPKLVLSGTTFQPTRIYAAETVYYLATNYTGTAFSVQHLNVQTQALLSNSVSFVIGFDETPNTPSLMQVIKGTAVTTSKKYNF